MTADQVIAEVNKTIDRLKGYVEDYMDGITSDREMRNRVIMEAYLLSTNLSKED